MTELKARITIAPDKRSFYNVGEYQVVFNPWHSTYLDEDFIAVTVIRGGCEVMHSGMTKLEPSEKAARDVVDAMLALREALEK